LTKLPVVFLIAFIFLAGCTNIEEDKSQSQPTQATVNPVTTSQPTKTPNESSSGSELESSTSPNVTPTPTQKTSSSSADSNSIVYMNTQYGFQFSLPERWKGYSIINSKWEGLAKDGESSEKVVETGPLISIRDSQWTAQTPRQDIPIMVFTLSQWNSLQRGVFHIGASPIGPSELGRNDTYVFALPARYNYSFPPGYEEVDKILKSKPLKALESE
jgi:hypothetical protein